MKFRLVLAVVVAVLGLAAPADAKTNPCPPKAHYSDGGCASPGYPGPDVHPGYPGHP